MAETGPGLVEGIPQKLAQNSYMMVCLNMFPAVGAVAVKFYRCNEEMDMQRWEGRTATEVVPTPQP
eukprot:8649553-Pyramimonas_sp.AAC.1